MKIIKTAPENGFISSELFAKPLINNVKKLHSPSFIHKPLKKSLLHDIWLLLSKPAD